MIEGDEPWQPETRAKLAYRLIYCCHLRVKTQGLGCAKKKANRGHGEDQLVPNALESVRSGDRSAILDLCPIKNNAWTCSPFVRWILA